MRLKLNAAKTYVKSLNTSLNPISLNNVESIKLSAKVMSSYDWLRQCRDYTDRVLLFGQVYGLGPIFQIHLELNNNNADNYLADLVIVCDYDYSLYRVEHNVIRLPCLMSIATYRYINKVECISELNMADVIKVRSLSTGMHPRNTRGLCLADLHNAWTRRNANGHCRGEHASQRDRCTRAAATDQFGIARHWTSQTIIQSNYLCFIGE